MKLRKTVYWPSWARGEKTKNHILGSKITIPRILEPHGDGETLALRISFPGGWYGLPWAGPRRGRPFESTAFLNDPPGLVSRGKKSLKKIWMAMKVLGLGEKNTVCWLRADSEARPLSPSGGPRPQGNPVVERLWGRRRRQSRPWGGDPEIMSLYPVHRHVGMQSTEVTEVLW